MNEKKDKIALLAAISNGEVNPKSISSKSVIVSDRNEVFTGIMVSVAARKKGSSDPVVFVGKAKDTIEEITQRLNKKRSE